MTPISDGVKFNRVVNQIILRHKISPSSLKKSQANMEANKAVTSARHAEFLQDCLQFACSDDKSSTCMCSGEQAEMTCPWRESL